VISYLQLELSKEEEAACPTTVIMIKKSTVSQFCWAMDGPFNPNHGCAVSNGSEHFGANRTTMSGCPRVL
jgi:hypothetical protein